MDRMKHYLKGMQQRRTAASPQGSLELTNEPQHRFPEQETIFSSYRKRCFLI
jgi:hypothetical protein